MEEVKKLREEVERLKGEKERLEKEMRVEKMKREREKREREEEKEKEYEDYSIKKIREGLGHIHSLETKLRNEMENTKMTSSNREEKSLVGIHSTQINFPTPFSENSGDSRSNILFVKGVPLPEEVESQLTFRRRMMLNTITNKHLHFIDETSTSTHTHTVFMLHGNGQWCFTWRKVVSLLKSKEKKVRIICPDLMGFGMSSRLQSFSDHSLELHLLFLLQLILSLDLRNLILVGFEWGALLASVLAARLPERVSGVVLCNASDWNPSLFKITNSLASKSFKKLAHVPLLRSLSLHLSCLPLHFFHSHHSLSPKERRAYQLPLSSWKDRASILAFATFLPLEGKSVPSNRVIHESLSWAQHFRGQLFLLFSVGSLKSKDATEKVRLSYPAARILTTGAKGLLIQEEDPSSILRAIISIVESTQDEGNKSENPAKKFPSKL